MLIYQDPDEWESTSERHVCQFHKMNPGQMYAGCTCSAAYGQRQRSPEEVAEIKKRNRLEYEEKILTEADAIRTRRVS